MPETRPSNSALRAFVAAARSGSFRDAAASLGVTPSAVSHQVRALEGWIGSPLFDRGVRQVRLTHAGAALSRSLGDAFDCIDRALADAQRAAAPRRLRIAALPLFASAWLAPRLSRFETAYPDLSLSVDTEARIADIAGGEADVGIRNVAAPTTGLAARKLLDLRATPLCTPDLAANLSEPSALSNATLIGLSVGRAGWPEWLAAAGVAGLTPRRTLTFYTLTSAVEAAASGRGVLLGLLPLILDTRAADGLVAPFALTPQDAGAYFVVRRREDANSATIKGFVDWLFEEMRADAGRLRRIERERLAAGRAD